MVGFIVALELPGTFVNRGVGHGLVLLVGSRLSVVSQFYDFFVSVRWSNGAGGAGNRQTAGLDNVRQRIAGFVFGFVGRMATVAQRI